MQSYVFGLLTKTNPYYGRPGDPPLEVPITICVSVVLKSYGTDEEGFMTLTPECSTLEEFDYWWSCLERDLKLVRREGRRLFDQCDRKKKKVFASKAG